MPFNELPGDIDFKDHELPPEDFVCWKRHKIKDTLQPLWKGPYQVLICEWTSTPVYRHQRLLGDKKPLTPEVDCYLKTSKTPVYLWIDTEPRIHFICLYLSANISHNNSYTFSLGFSIAFNCL